ncbi:MAG: glycosyltransferase family 4 protein [Roseivirga sp.]|nr:glycosyltransferase family 4 protein [Roseivirga sp.]
MSKKVLIITYYWPPSGGGGVQRWLKFAKYLPDFGWSPVVFTPENPDFDQKDESLLKEVPSAVEVLHFPIWEPYGIFKKLSGKKELKQGQVLEGGKKGPLSKLAIWLRGNLFVPDPRVFWVKPSVEYLSTILRSNKISTIITTGPPHSVHLIGMRLKMENPGLKWVADFRDPWSQWDILKQFRMMPLTWRKHKKLEQQVFKVADKLITVSKSWQADFRSLGARRISVITNGFDITGEELNTAAPSTKFVMSHLGMLNKLRNPLALWKALEQLISGNADFATDFTLRLTGILSKEVLGTIASYPKLAERLQTEASVPHEQVFEVYRESTVLLLILNQSENAQGHLPGKLFEYLSAERPVLALGLVNSDAAQILEETQAGKAIDWNNETGIKNHITRLYQDWKSGRSIVAEVDVNKYSRRALTGELAALLDEL